MWREFMNAMVGVTKNVEKNECIYIEGLIEVRNTRGETWPIVS